MRNDGPPPRPDRERNAPDDRPTAGGRPAADVPPGPSAEWDELADAADQAFRLLPAPPEETPAEGRPHSPARRITADPDSVERDLVKLVLTLVELLRQLMERQALRRVESGDLSEEQEERLGTTLMLLHDRMTRLCARYDLTMEDLNLDLGPLGPLLPPEQ